MAVQFINVESFIFLRKFIGPNDQLTSASIVFLCFCAGAQKNMAAKFKGRAFYRSLDNVFVHNAQFIRNAFVA